MSLGGYKFAGKYCEKGSLTDVQWALLMHKTKVAAFMAANAIADAGWDYDMTGSPDGNYHCLDAVGNNYVTVFKRTNGTDDYTWFAIYTLCKFTWSGTDSGAIKLYIYANYSNAYFGYYATSFYSIGASAIAYSDDLSTSPTSHANIIGPMPMGNPGANGSDISSSYYPPSGTSFKDATTVWFGYAVKGDSIVMFQGNGSTIGSSAYTSCSVASGHGFSSLANPSDTCGVFAYNTQIESDVGSGSAIDYNKENASRNVSTENMQSQLCCAADGSTGLPVYSAKITTAVMAFYATSVQEYPFQSITIYGVLNNNTKIYGKGTVAIDLISVNFPGRNQGLTPDVYSTVANGNYLCVNVISGAYYYQPRFLNQLMASYASMNAAMYVGWDPSNPDITQASAWSLYDGA